MFCVQRKHVYGVQINIKDRKQYELVLAYDQGELSLYVDKVLIGGARKLVPNHVAECGKAAEDCVFSVGQRAPGRYRLTGVVYDFKAVDGVATSAYPGRD